MSNRPRRRPAHTSPARSASASGAEGSKRVRWIVAGSVVAAVVVAIVVGAVARSSQSDVAAPPTLDAQAERGAQIAQSRGCVSCHTSSGNQSEGPTWKGIYGQQVELADGTSVTVDDAYIAQSVREPSAQIAAGYPSRMPTANPALTDDEIAAITAYIKALR